MLRFLIRTAAVLLPLFPFAYAAQVVLEWLSKGETLPGIILLLGSLAGLALVEGLIFRCWLLPIWAQSLGEKLYGGTYSPEEDELAQLTAQLRRSEDPALLPLMQQTVRKHRKRARGWLELARIYQDVMHDHKSALQTMLQGAEAVSDPEERAMFLYRAGALAADKLQSSSTASELFARAASSFPNTTYGKHAAARAAKK